MPTLRNLPRTAPATTAITAICTLVFLVAALQARSVTDVVWDSPVGTHTILYGPEVYAQLCERWGQTPPVILVTAERDASLRRQAAEKGWGFLAKPVRPPALRALMSQMLLRIREG